MGTIAHNTRDRDQILQLSPTELPPPAGSSWEEAEPGRWRLVRFEAAWREAIRSLTATRSLEAGVSTWRFRTNSPFLTWRGRWDTRRADMRQLQVWVDGVRETSIELRETTGETELCLFDAGSETDHEVVIHFPATTSLTLTSVGVKPGTELESVPAGLRWCSWGDSITQGTLCASSRDSYVQRTAARLGWTAMNRGFGGAGYPDPMTAMAVACGDPWDILTIAIGINSALKGQETAAEFGEMYRLCLDIITGRCPGRPVVCISPILCQREMTEAGERIEPRARDITQAIRRAVDRTRHPGVTFLNGLALLSETQGLAPDKVHPNCWGHERIAERLAPILSGVSGRWPAAL